MQSFEMKFDGGSRGNPGPAAVGVVILDSDTGEPWLEFGEYIGSRTNNQAEYTALKEGLSRFLEELEDAAIAPEDVDLSLTTDSQLLQKQLEGHWDTNDADLRRLQDDVRKQLEGFHNWSIRHVPRERNRDADDLVNRALDRELGDGDPEANTGEGSSGNDTDPEPSSTLFLTVHGTGGGKSTSGSWSYRIVDDQERELVLRKERVEVEDANLAVFHAVRNGLATIQTLLDGAGTASETASSGDNVLAAPKRTALVIRGVNDVVMKQISGEYGCKNPEHRNANGDVQEQLSHFHSVRTGRADEEEMEALQKADTLA